jgi:hypothetical protein
LYLSLPGSYPDYLKVFVYCRTKLFWWWLDVCYSDGLTWDWKIRRREIYQSVNKSSSFGLVAQAMPRQYRSLLGPKSGLLKGPEQESPCPMAKSMHDPEERGKSDLQERVFFFFFLRGISASIVYTTSEFDVNLTSILESKSVTHLIK